MRGKRANDPELAPPFRSGIKDDKGPNCHDCTWVLNRGKWRIKYVNRACSKHGNRA